MSHIRQQLREAFAAQVTGLTTSGTDVFQSRIRNMAAADIPGLRVYSEQEQIEDDDVLAVPYLQRRTITIRCEAVAKATANLDDTLDTMCKEVEVAIAANSTLGGLAKLHCSLLSTNIRMDGNSEVPAGMATMTWRVLAYTMSNAPDVAV